MSDLHGQRATTIAAISTPPGSGGIGIIRISGTNALAVLQRIFLPQQSNCAFASHHLYYGHIVKPASSLVYDEVLAVYMQAPRTYTREDVVEIHCHGSYLVLHSVLELILAEGVVLAEPGEFTKRAFLNGRIDLTRAEAVIDILSARTRKGVGLAQQQLAGALYGRADDIRQALVSMRAQVEVALDFPDDDLEILDHADLITSLCDKVMAPLQALLHSADQGRLYREGIAVAITGLPNVGKSSLLNALLQEERALVTPIAGTTRDTIEEYLDIEGMPVRIIDTAGIREDAGEVEELGIQRARGAIDLADLVLFVLDGSQPVRDEDLRLFASVAHKPCLVAVNKIDLYRGGEKITLANADTPLVHISAKNQLGISELKSALFKMVAGGREQWEEDGCGPNLRHKNALEKAYQASLAAHQALLAGLTNDLIAVDLQECLDQLGAIVGETTTEDVLDVIFSQFCLGK